MSESSEGRVAAAARWSEVWKHVRVYLLGLHVLAISLMAFPAPGGGMSRQAWKDPTVQDEFEIWRGRFAAFGYSGDEARFEDDLWAFASRFMAVRGGVLAPFMPYYEHAAVWQPWRMFVAPHRYPCRLEVDVRENGEWRPVFVERSREYDWRAAQFGHDRLRAAIFRYSWDTYHRSWTEFADWIAARAKEDFPDADEVRARFYKQKSPTPEQVRAGIEPEGEWIDTVTRPLKASAKKGNKAKKKPAGPRMDAPLPAVPRATVAPRPATSSPEAP